MLRVAPFNVDETFPFVLHTSAAAAPSVEIEAARRIIHRAKEAGVGEHKLNSLV